jgi:hypothetical protein
MSCARTCCRQKSLPPELAVAIMSCARTCCHHFMRQNSMPQHHASELAAASMSCARTPCHHNFSIFTPAKCICPRCCQTASDHPPRTCPSLGQYALAKTRCLNPLSNRCCCGTCAWPRLGSCTPSAVLRLQRSPWLFHRLGKTSLFSLSIVVLLNLLVLVYCNCAYKATIHRVNKATVIRQSLS